MRTLLFFIAFIITTVASFGQDEKSLGALESDTIWLKEIIKFPIGFAPEIKYTGYEDLRFAKQWRAIDHDDFWCYMFVWHVDGFQNPSAKDLEQQLKLYYDGLMKAVNKKKDFEVPETTVLVIDTKNDSNSNYIGRLKVYDSFNSEEIITLNVLVKLYHCTESNTTNIMFRLSPLDFDQAIWERFENVKLIDKSCKYKI